MQCTDRVRVGFYLKARLKHILVDTTTDAAVAIDVVFKYGISSSKFYLA